MVGSGRIDIPEPLGYSDLRFDFPERPIRNP